MVTFELDARMRLSIELAIAATGRDPLFLLELEQTGRALGMTGAEIDAAKKGSSFDARIATAIVLALAPGEEPRRRARRAGLSERACTEIEKLPAVVNRRRS